MKCITCGINEAIIHGQCEGCFREHLQLTTTGALDVTICPKCGAFKIGNMWSRGKIENALFKKISSHLAINDTNVSATILKDSIALQRLENRITFHTELKTEGNSFGEMDGEIPAKILMNSCLTCNKITGSYYEAIIQLRTLTAEYTPVVNAVLDDISAILEKMDRGDNDSFVSKIEPVRGGVDIYLGKKNDGIKLSKFIHDHYFSNTTTTKKLAGRRNGENFYRYTYLVRLFNLDPGTVLSNKEKSFILERVRSNALTVIDPTNEKRYDILQNDFNNGAYTYSSESVENRKFFVVSAQEKESLIMDQENFQVITVKGHFEGEILGFNYNGRIIVANSDSFASSKQ